MNAKQLFDYIGYFEDLWQSNKLAQTENFKFCTCSGIETLQGPLQQFRTANAFFCVDAPLQHQIDGHLHGSPR